MKSDFQRLIEGLSMYGAYMSDEQRKLVEEAATILFQEAEAKMEVNRNDEDEEVGKTTE